jgi:hypothetical protein
VVATRHAVGVDPAAAPHPRLSGRRARVVKPRAGVGAHSEAGADDGHAQGASVHHVWAGTTHLQHRKRNPHGAAMSQRANGRPPTGKPMQSASATIHLRHRASTPYAPSARAQEKRARDATGARLRRASETVRRGARGGLRRGAISMCTMRICMWTRRRPAKRPRRSSMRGEGPAQYKLSVCVCYVATGKFNEAPPENHIGHTLPPHHLVLRFQETVVDDEGGAELDVVLADAMGTHDEDGLELVDPELADASLRFSRVLETKGASQATLAVSSAEYHSASLPWALNATHEGE